ncbi:ring finger domain containing protein [Nitzschia inconspicua]|uniref:Ring finger domain containing protein n=1 Tax=Nitzschia inconspicua TaxID=303405 RepID=A0A9K3LXB5_9STRA|nr:ring finger domain containing protein [Nitzschia inconspicua]
MNFSLPNFFDYLQNQPSLNIVQQHLEYADVETASISTMILTIFLLLSTVEGVVLFFTTLYNWCLFPIHHAPEGEEESDGSLYRRRRRRRIGSHGGEHHFFWWLDVDYDSESNLDEDDDHDDDDDDFYNGNDVNDRWSPYRALDHYKKVDRKDRIRFSLQEHTFHGTQFEDSCAICLTDFAASDRVVSGAQPCCRSCFHRNCLEEWLKIQSSCPCCRSNLLLKSREIMSRRKKEQETDESSEHNPTTSNWTTTIRIEPQDSDQLLESSEFSESQLTRRGATGVVPSWTPDIVPETSTSGSWDEFWFLIF